MILTLIFISFLMVGSVNASLVDYNFDNDFSMNVPKDSNFVQQTVPQSDDDTGFIGDEKDYVDEKNQLAVLYIESELISNDTVDGWYDNLFSVFNYNLTKYWESQSDGIKIFEPKGSSDEYFSMVGVHSENKTVVVFGEDTSLILKMANTVKFN